MFLESGLLRRGLMDRAYLAKSCVGSAKALNSKALPEGSLKNMVATRQAFESDIGINYKGDTARFDARSKRVEFIPVQHNTEMRHRNLVVVHGVVMWGIRLRDQVGHDLVAKQVEVNPLRTRSTFLTTEYGAVKLPCQGQVGDRKRNVKWINFSHLNTEKCSCV
jgi:hypothetical protein